VGTARPGLPEDWRANLERLEHASRMELSRLGPKDLASLLIDAFHSEKLAGELALRIAAKSDGNPFFVFEIIRGLREGQFIARRPDGTWASTRVIEEIEIPSSVLDLVNARVADLSEEERDLLDVACCRGFEFDPGLVGEVLGLGRIPALKRFGQIERRHRLVRSSWRNYVFDHHQVQEALYGSLNEQLREEYHAALAGALEVRTKAADADPETLDGALCVDLCEHYLRGARGASALRYFDAALTHLEKGYLNAPAVDLAEQALAVPGLLAGLERAKILLRLGEGDGPLDRMGRRARQEEVAREAERLAEVGGDEGLRGRAARALGVMFRRTSRNDEAEAALRRALEIAVAECDREGEARATGSLGVVFFNEGGLAEAREQYGRNLAMSREIGDRRGEAIAQHNLGSVLREEGDPARAEARLAASLALCEEIGLRHEAAATHLALGTLRVAAGEGPAGRASLESARDLAAEIGAPGVETLARCELALLPGGDAEDALRAFAASDERLSAEERREARWLLFRATGDRAHLEEAKRLLDSAVALVPEDIRRSMLENLRVNREILKAWKEHGGG